MLARVRAAGLGLALSIFLSAGGASAQSDEGKALGLQVAHAMFQAMSIEAIITEAAMETSDVFADVKSRPEWAGYLIAAIQEEVQHDMPAIESMFGRALARSMTVPELKAGIIIMSDPATQTMMRASAAGDDAPTVSYSRATDRVVRSAAGAAFLAKLETIDRLMAPLQEEFIVELMPGAFRRFADKAEAGEVARKAKAAP